MICKANDQPAGQEALSACRMTSLHSNHKELVVDCAAPGRIEHLSEQSVDNAGTAITGCYCLPCDTTLRSAPCSCASQPCAGAGSMALPLVVAHSIHDPS